MTGTVPTGGGPPRGDGSGTPPGEGGETEGWTQVPIPKKKKSVDTAERARKQLQTDALFGSPEAQRRGRKDGRGRGSDRSRSRSRSQSDGGRQSAGGTPRSG